MSDATDTRNRDALDPARSVVVEACAGSGKTWLLVSRIVRLLLAGAGPSEILAITFTRKAAQEMAARLRSWLALLATGSDDEVLDFLRQREVAEDQLAALLPVARGLYEKVLTAQPSVTVSTFHAWFLQLMRRAPLNAGAPGDVTLAEQTSGLVDDAWQRFAAATARDRDSPAARGLDTLFTEYGLENTRKLLGRFLRRRADWWAYAEGGDAGAAVARALEALEAAMRLPPGTDVLAALLGDARFVEDLRRFADWLAKNTPTDQAFGEQLTAALALADPAMQFPAVRAALLRGDGEPLSRKSGKAQAKRLGAEGESVFLDLHGALAARVQQALQDLADQCAYRLNAAALPCAVQLLAAYEEVKRDRQVIDYADIEWHAWRLLADSDHAAYLQAKLDSRYAHVLLDEFQDTNPLQWLTLKAWFDAAAEADARPTVFLVGDPKQSIYRFRRAEAKLFGAAAAYLGQHFGARRLAQNESRRCAPAVIEAVNRVFGGLGDAFEGFAPHTAHYTAKPGRVEVLPLEAVDPAQDAEADADAVLRNPLERPLVIADDQRRANEAGTLARRLKEAVGHWTVWSDHRGESQRAARYGDVMILVRRRTHLETYEQALREARIPFVTSRQGGLLDTLEAQDMTALLEFLVAPFADLKLAHALRAPMFGASDDDLVALAGTPGATWRERLSTLVAAKGASPALQRADRLIAGWQDTFDRLPVHDLLDRIYFEGDVIARYRAAVPAVMAPAVTANLHAFMQRALDTDAGRYPSLPRFLDELRDLRAAPPEEAPGEGTVEMAGDNGDAVRIHTVHGAKGLEAPIVWLPDCAARTEGPDGYDVMVAWDGEAAAPAHFSLWSRQGERAAVQIDIAEAEALRAARENLNLLYVAMTRAQQVLVVSGCAPTRGNVPADSWYARVQAALAPAAETGAALPLMLTPPLATVVPQTVLPASVSPALSRPRKTGSRHAAMAGQGERYGTRFHVLMERLSADRTLARAAFQREFGVPAAEMESLWAQAQGVLGAAALARFFDPARYVRALNEVPFVTAAGAQGRLDRLVEFTDEVWVLDYKTGDSDPQAALAAYRPQLDGYLVAMRALFGAKTVRAALVLKGGLLVEAAQPGRSGQ
ncbi:MAG: UvrD-helicase domain-containing protein [Burkholderiales bacterium]